jgi:hypothetical protein
MGLQLSTGWQGDLLRANLIGKVGAEGLRRLFPQVSLDEAEKFNSFDDLRLDKLGRQVPAALKSDSASKYQVTGWRVANRSWRTILTLSSLHQACGTWPV